MNAERLSAPAERADAPIDELTLVSMLSSRICHDLVGPIGALGNGVEFLNGQVDEGTRDHAIRVISDSVSQASARLQFYRAAFGMGGSLSDQTRLSDLRDLTEMLLEGGRVSLDWEPDEREEISRGATRLMMNLILLGVETLPRGGVLRAGLVRPDGARNAHERMMLVVAEGPMLKLTPRIKSLLLRGALSADDAPLEPKESPAVLTHRIAQSIAARLNCAEEEDHVILAATL
ncbi:MAG: histidine phosphotransferase family protein [Pseudomonadota bacterium]